MKANNKETKIILVTADFYSEYTVYKTTDAADLKNWVRDMVNERYRPLDESKHALLENHDTISTEEAIEMANEVIYMGDLEEE